jgi:hypothetical protein
MRSGSLSTAVQVFQSIMRVATGSRRAGCRCAVIVVAPPWGCQAREWGRTQGRTAGRDGPSGNSGGFVPFCAGAHAHELLLRDLQDRDVGLSVRFRHLQPRELGLNKPGDVTVKSGIRERALIKTLPPSALL